MSAFSPGMFPCLCTWKTEDVFGEGEDMDEGKTPPPPQGGRGPGKYIFVESCLQKQVEAPRISMSAAGCSSGTGLAAGSQDDPIVKSPGALLGTWETSCAGQRVREHAEGRNGGLGCPSGWHC